MVLLLAALWLACSSGPAGDPAWVPGSGALTEPPPKFSGKQALEDARRIAGSAPRPAGSRSAERTRAFIQDELARMGATIEGLAPANEASGPEPSAATQPGSVPAPLIGALAGRSDDVILLIAAYDTTVDGDADTLAGLDAASGAAVLLELGRALAARPRPYTVWLTFVEGDAVAKAPEAAGLRFAGTGALVSLLDQTQSLERVRLSVFFADLARPDLRIVRDLRSHRVHREIFWDSARELGLVEVFVQDAGFAAPEQGHWALLESSLRGVVGIVGEGSGSQAEASIDGAQRDAMAQRLDELGAVSLDALDAIAERLSRIDRFSEAPLSADRWEAAPPRRDAEPTAEPAFEGPAARADEGASSR